MHVSCFKYCNTIDMNHDSSSYRYAPNWMKALLDWSKPKYLLHKRTLLKKSINPGPQITICIKDKLHILSNMFRLR